MLSPADTYATPLGDLKVDHEIYGSLQSSGLFDRMTLSQDEAEHSLEMHLPFVARLFSPKEVTIVPIVVGALSASSEQRYGELLAPFVDDERNLFALSSDFCHWGARFGYTPYDKSKAHIAQPRAAAGFLSPLMLARDLRIGFARCWNWWERGARGSGEGRKRECTRAEALACCAFARRGSGRPAGRLFPAPGRVASMQSVAA